MSKTIRDEVFDVISDERDYQDRVWPNRTHPVAHELVLLNHYITKANKEWSENVGEESALFTVRKIAAIATRCMENNGAPRRKD